MYSKQIQDYTYRQDYRFVVVVFRYSFKSSEQVQIDTEIAPQNVFRLVQAKGPKFYTDTGVLRSRDVDNRRF